MLDRSRFLRMLAAMDPSSYANLSDWKCVHMSLDWHMDFQTKTVTGSNTLTLRYLGSESATSASLILDTRDLNVTAVTQLPLGFPTKVTDKPPTVGVDSVARSMTFEVDTTVSSAEALGHPLTISDVLLEEDAEEGFTGSKVRIHYSTSSTATGAQWLTAAQTAGGKHPYLFTQFQAIHCRSMIPCQDSPSVKVTLDARVTVEGELSVVMSAPGVGSDEKDGKKTFMFSQPLAMPTYLIAFIVGNVDKVQLGKRSWLWTEPEWLDRCKYEFQDTEKYITTLETILPEYAWKYYGLVVLPPSFPYGGMENVNLTFVTPTLLAGDRSLSDVVCHEIAHSWSGNLVTNKYWTDFWLNEGHTVFLERRVLQRLSGKQHWTLSAMSGLTSLKDSIREFNSRAKDPSAGHPFTALIPPLSGGVDPDDAFSSVPYEKGFLLLLYLEQKIIGSEKAMDQMLNAYFTQFAGTSVTSADWKQWLFSYWESKDPAVFQRLQKDVDWEKWFHQPGLPVWTGEETWDRTLADTALALANAWAESTALESFVPPVSAAELKKWSTAQCIVFLDRLLERSADMSHDRIRAMEQTYSRELLCRNSETRFRWIQVCIKAEFEDILGDATRFLAEQGRMKFIRPIYASLQKSQIGSALAKATFDRYKATYHPVAAKMVARTLGL